MDVEGTNRPAPSAVSPARFRASMFVMVVLAFLQGCASLSSKPVTLVWEPIDITFTATRSLTWNTFPIQVTFTHETGVSHTLDAFYEGDNQWTVRFAPSVAGIWIWDVGQSPVELPRSGKIKVVAASHKKITANPNLRGHLKAIPGERYFWRADGTPFFFVADTNWYALTCRSGTDSGSRFCGDVLDNDVSRGSQDLTTRGPANTYFSQWLSHRAAKGFTALMIRYVPGNLNGSNEGGCAFPIGKNPLDINDCHESDWDNLNPEFFASADKRIERIWELGLVLAGHPNWIASSTNTEEQAENLTRYLLSRYAAYSLVWSLSGEFQNSGNKDPSWQGADKDYQPFRSLGRRLRDGGSEGTWFEKYDYHHPISIHPVGSPPDASDSQTSAIIFSDEPWLDHNWVQTYTFPEYISFRLHQAWTMDNKPVLMSEPCYENFVADVNCNRDQLRYSIWESLLSGAAGYTYGVQGIYRMNGSNVENLDTPGANDVLLAKEFFMDRFPSNSWSELVPNSCARVNGVDVDPKLLTLASPRCSRQDQQRVVLYLPKRSPSNVTLVNLKKGSRYEAQWFNPRDGATVLAAPFTAEGAYPVPPKPNPSNNDWVLFVEKR